jgi:flagellar protein FliS
MYSNGIQSYRKTNVITADPGKLVIMCYEGAIDNLKLAKRKFNEQDYEGKGKAVTKTLDILDELLCALDFEKGGSIASNLESLYNFMTRRILQAEAEKDIDGFDEIIRMLSELLAAWQDIFSRQTKKTTHPRVQMDDYRMHGEYNHVTL